MSRGYKVILSVTLSLYILGYVFGGPALFYTRESNFLNNTAGAIIKYTYDRPIYYIMGGYDNFCRASTTLSGCVNHLGRF